MDADSKLFPIFKDVFGKSWDELPPVLKKHYANRPNSFDRVTVQGTLDISCRSYMRLLRPFYRFIGGVPAVSQSCVPVTVHFDSSYDSNAFHFKRTFHWRDAKPYQFESQMVPVAGSEVFEVMRFGVCWRATFGWDGTKVVLRHRGYALRIFGHYVPLPITPIIGRSDASETAVDDDKFDMKVEITHPLVGIVYSYYGRFRVVKEA